MLTSSEAVLRAIHLAFPVRPRPRSREITKEGDDYFERVNLRRALKGRSWKALSPAQLWSERRSLVWLAPVGFGYYLPAWMCLSFRDGEALESTLLNLRGYREGIAVGLRDPRRDGLDRPRVAAITGFLEHWSAHGSDRGAADDAAVARDALASYWRERLAATT